MTPDLLDVAQVHLDIVAMAWYHDVTRDLLGSGLPRWMNWDTWFDLEEIS